MTLLLITQMKNCHVCYQSIPYNQQVCATCNSDPKITIKCADIFKKFWLKPDDLKNNDLYIISIDKKGRQTKKYLTREIYHLAKKVSDRLPDDKKKVAFLKSEKILEKYYEKNDDVISRKKQITYFIEALREKYHDNDKYVISELSITNRAINENIDTFDAAVAILDKEKLRCSTEEKKIQRVHELIDGTMGEYRFAVRTFFDALDVSNKDYFYCEHLVTEHHRQLIKKNERRCEAMRYIEEHIPEEYREYAKSHHIYRTYVEHGVDSMGLLEQLVASKKSELSHQSGDPSVGEQKLKI